MSLNTAEYRRLALIAAGVDPSEIPPILSTATWRKMMIVALSQPSQGPVEFPAPDGSKWRLSIDNDGILQTQSMP